MGMTMDIKKEHRTLYVVLIPHKNPKWTKNYIDTLVRHKHYFLDKQEAEKMAEEWTKLLGFKYEVFERIG